MDNQPSSAPQGVTPEKDDEFWFDDGNIVLIANNDVAFRFYKGLLARASPIFQDMFSIFQPHGEKEMMDGCIVVRLHEDPHDLRAFLKATMGIPLR